MSEYESRTEQPPSGDPSASGQPDVGHSAEVPGGASPHAKAVQEERSAADERHGLVAIAAYHRAERRGFGPGCEVDDWLEAEAEIDQRADAQSE